MLIRVGRLGRFSSLIKGIITPSTYDPSAEAYFAAMTVQPDTTRKTNINTLVESLKTAGIWSKLDWLSLYASHSAQAALLNIIDPTLSATGVSTPVFTTDRGYQRLNTSSYINSNFNPVTAPNPKFVRDSLHAGIYSLTNLTDPGAFDFGHYSVSGTRINARSNNANTFRGHASATASSNFGANATSLGHFLINRVSSTSVTGYYDGSLAGTVASTSAAMPSSNFHILGSSGDVTSSNRQLAAVHWGSSLSTAEVADFYLILNTYLSAVGASTNPIAPAPQITMTDDGFTVT